MEAIQSDAADKLRSMPAPIQRQLEEFDAARRALLDDLEKLPEKRLAEHSIPGKWSIIEIVEHLVLGEKEVLAGLPNPSTLKAADRSLKDRLMYWVVLGVLRFRVNVKTPAKAMDPTGACSLAELRARWDGSQKWLRAYAESLGAGGLESAVFSHPVAGPMTLEQTLRMAKTHFDLHATQIQRLLSVTDSPQKA